MSSRNVMEALTREPLGLLRTSWTWRSAFYLLAGGVLGVGGCVSVGGIVASWQRIGLATAAIAVLGVLAFVAAVAGPVEQWRLRLVDREAHPVPNWPRATGWGTVSILALGWADLAVVLLAAGIPGALITAPLQPTAGPFASIAGPVAGILLLPVAAYPVVIWAGVRSTAARLYLLPRDGELREVRRSRARLVDAYEAERRRIERDLHDGAQQRLVALSVKLGLAGLDLPAGSRAAQEVEEAHQMAKAALVELRELIQGVHPHVLTERGLPAAIRDVAGRSPIPVDLEVDVGDRLSPSVEVAAYYAVCEALANAAKHSEAERCLVRAWRERDLLVVEVSDDGRGGAVAEAGTGLTGLADRVSAVDGRMLLASPIGGPTRLRVEIPCGS
ncbi:sensor histidine kinase [Streptomyces sp. NBC_01304]|uniref:sensor histidine kinase n=1 Tax=Streptomyces sp. NBC_01304 TaxID=2903818 RepID=UPI002E11F6AE|nr:sensor histidine kinase [Streptomyces sp. NBC_01304]